MGSLCLRLSDVITSTAPRHGENIDNDVLRLILYVKAHSNASSQIPHNGYKFCEHPGKWNTMKKPGVELRKTKNVNRDPAMAEQDAECSRKKIMDHQAQRPSFLDVTLATRCGEPASGHPTSQQCTDIKESVVTVHSNRSFVCSLYAPVSTKGNGAQNTLLQEYDFEVRYLPRVENVSADALSRLVSSECVDTHECSDEFDQEECVCESGFKFIPEQRWRD
ncbi:hypothetical protein NDU88_004573 [Pleurodeles waltl]|uniref:Uncharacterized protein n=1 Tax=Pleurodeles waltl TaxID=8319 RepID=A0AAV7W5C6_PLEWA|nr:hypothetical protein NDU88_004573 [Pleurodeles waltl]